ncbi:ammonium transporter Rh type A-like [Paramacrobiotus metropolitanus]|uniref:ammonium transporter Rh type A-like n=1 Tax=Paramacrobiotus metropolitanus TaxID=2943436 RepID=UPI00244652B5|nr:ammonium transporter Rh type A-like [Paramacrobiotus metropolitanus]
MQEVAWRRGKLGLLIFVCEAAFIIIFGCLVDYGWEGTPPSRRQAQFGRGSVEEQYLAKLNHSNITFNPALEKWIGREALLRSMVPKSPAEGARYYTMFQDVHVMVFIGFGFLMTCLKKYGYSAVGMTFLVAAFVLQWGTILRGFYRLAENSWRINLDFISIISAEFTAATVLITLGVVLGKLSPIQYVIMLMIETVLVTVNEWICYDLLLIKDAGGTIVIHLFGAYFGLALSRTMHRRQFADPHFNDLKEMSRFSDLFSMVGTLFLWLFWPSFNAVMAMDDGRYRAVYNTYFAIAASCLGAFMVSTFVKHEKFCPEIIQNSTLAGGVVVGAVCDMYLYPFGALICGFFIGCISALGYHFGSPILDRKLGIHDSVGVHNLHAIPAFVGGLISAIVAGCATPEVYGTSFYGQFPGQVPMENTPEYKELLKTNANLKPGYGWSASMQGGYQLAGMAVTLAIAIGGGIFTGLILRIPLWNRPTMYEVLDDKPYWEMPSKLHRDDEAALRERLDRQEKGLPTETNVHFSNGKSAAHGAIQNAEANASHAHLI